MSKRFMESIKKARHHAGQIGRRTKTLLVYTFITVITSGMSATAYGQTFAEWFSQKKTQKKYLLEQLAALQVYGSYLKKGYNVARNGLGSVSDYLEKEYGAHAIYYNRLLAISPAIKNDPQIRDILTRQQEIVKVLGITGRLDGLSNTERQYTARVSAAVMHDCESQLQELERVITGGKFQAGDQERIEAINRIQEAMVENYRFCSGFAAQISILIGRREHQRNDLATSRWMQGIH